MLFRQSVLAAVLAAIVSVPHPAFPSSASQVAGPANADYLNLPLVFEENRGQAGPEAHYVGHGQNYNVALKSGGIVLGFPGARPGADRRFSPGRMAADSAPTTGTAIEIRFVGARDGVWPKAAEPLAARANYLIGNDKTKWVQEAPMFAKVRYDGLYPGISLVAYGLNRQMEYDFEVSPNADPAAIALAIDGARGLSLDSGGNLVVALGGRDLVMHKPVAYQTGVAGRTMVEARYDLGEGGCVGLRVGDYDRTRPLVIDPVLAYSTYIGGTGNDEVHAIAVDSTGAIYATGAAGTAFPTKAGSYDTTYNTGGDAFVTKLTPGVAGAAALVYSTYVGGSLADEGNGIAIDSSGNAYICGSTASANFPVSKTFGPLGGMDCFIAKLNAAGSSGLYSHRIGGGSNDVANGLVLDSLNNPYITGETFSLDWPTKNAPQGFYGTNGDAFALRIKASDSSLSYSTFIGGDGEDAGLGIALDTGGSAYVTGFTKSTLFPTRNAYDSFANGGTDAFLTKIPSSPSSNFTYSTYLGGTGEDVGTGVAVDAQFSAPVVVGYTASSDYPVTNEFQTNKAGGTYDAFVSRFLPAGDDLIASTYFGGNNSDAAQCVTIGSDNSVYFAGTTSSNNLPTENAFQGSRAAGVDGFVASFDSTMKNLRYSTYFGGAGDDTPMAILVDANFNAYVGGMTTGLFPTGGTPFQGTFGGGDTDGFLARLASTVDFARRDKFETGAVQAPGADTGWVAFGTNQVGLANPSYDSGTTSYRGNVSASASRLRVTGVLAAQTEWLPYSAVGVANYVRGKYYIFTGGQTNPALLNTIPSFRCRLSTRFAQASILEVFSHVNADSTTQQWSLELRPTNQSARPSLYRVDFDPVDVPYLASNASFEGIQRGFEAYAIDPQDNGYIAMAESWIGTYPKSALDDNTPDKVFAPTLLTPGNLAANGGGDPQIQNLILNADPTLPATVDSDPNTPLPTYSEGNFGFTMDSTLVPANRLAVVTRELNPGSDVTAADYLRVEEGKQYKVRWHITSTQASNMNAQFRMRSRTVRFSWGNKFEIGGAWSTGGSTPGANATIAQQLLPGIGCLNPERTALEAGGWYTHIFHTPLNPDIRPEIGGTLTSKMPKIYGDPGPGDSGTSRRDLRIACDLLDTLSVGVNAPLEGGNFTVDRIEVFVQDLVDD
ncbi:MAG: SBBP repeat-containing protein [Candidatus Sumerlaeaceae bacterium]|nr:SBBP repeat-containing protein [Candidatus Sumerlaeaceae bacterium]